MFLRVRHALAASWKRVIKPRLQRFPFLGRLVKNASWLYLANIVRLGANFFLAFYVVSRFSVADYGLIGLIVAYGMTIYQVIDFRIWETVINYFGAHLARGEYHKAHEVLRLCYVVDITTGVIGFFIVALGTNTASDLFMEGAKVVPLVLLYNLATLSRTAEGTSNAVLRVYGKYDWLALNNILSTVAKVIFTVALLSIQATLEAYFIAQLLIEGLSSAILYGTTWYVTRQQGRGRQSGGPSLSRHEIWTILKFTINTNVFGTLQHVTGNLQLLVLGFFATPAAVGLYRLAFNLINQLFQLRSPLIEVIYPEIVKIKASKRAHELYQLLRSSTLMALGIMGSLSLAMILLTDPLLRWVLNKPEYLPAIPFMRIMIIGLSANFLFFWLQLLLMASNKVSFLNLSLVFRMLVWFALAILLIPQLGAAGAATTYALSELLWTGFLALYTRRHKREILLRPTFQGGSLTGDARPAR